MRPDCENKCDKRRIMHTNKHNGFLINLQLWIPFALNVDERRTISDAVTDNKTIGLEQSHENAPFNRNKPTDKSYSIHLRSTHFFVDDFSKPLVVLLSSCVVQFHQMSHIVECELGFIAIKSTMSINSQLFHSPITR